MLQFEKLLTAADMTLAKAFHIDLRADEHTAYETLKPPVPQPPPQSSFRFLQDLHHALRAVEEQDRLRLVQERNSWRDVARNRLGWCWVWGIMLGLMVAVVAAEKFWKW